MATNDSDVNVVKLSTGVYNNIKAENYRLNMFLENILMNALITKNHERLFFPSESIEAAMKFCFAEKYKSRLNTLKSQHTRSGRFEAPDAPDVPEVVLYGGETR